MRLSFEWAALAKLTGRRAFRAVESSGAAWLHAEPIAAFQMGASWAHGERIRLARRGSGDTERENEGWLLRLVLEKPAEAEPRGGTRE